MADYRPATVATEKIKKAEGGFAIPLERTQDILRSLGEAKPAGQFLCGFAMETQNLEENARKKLETKNLDLVVGNNVKVAGSGFGAGTNVITFITKEGAEPQPRWTRLRWPADLWTRFWPCGQQSEFGCFG